MDIQQNNVAVLHFNLVNQDGSTIFIRKTKLATFNLINPSAVSVPITDIGFDATLNQCWVRVPKESNATTGQYYGVLNIVDDDWGTYTTSKIKVYSVVSDADEDTKSIVFTATCLATQVTNPSGGNSPYYNATTGTWWQYSDTLKAFEDTGVGNLIKYITKNVQHLKDGTGNGSIVTCLDDEISANNIATGLCSTDLGKNNDNEGESCVALGENNYIAEGVSNATAIAGARPSLVDVFAIGDKTGYKNVFEINKFGDISFRPDSSQERTTILQDILDHVIKNAVYDSSKYSLTVTFYSAADNANKTKTYDLSGLKAVLKDDAVKKISVNQSTAVMTVDTINGSSQQIQLPTSGDATTTTHGLMTAADKVKLDGISSGAEVNVQSDWSTTDTSADSYILNKPTALSSFTNDSGYDTVTSVNSKLASRLPLTGGTLTGDLMFSDSGTAAKGIYGTVGGTGNDAWRLIGGATARDAGWLELATADNGDEPIYVRQYSYSGETGTGQYSYFGVITRSATLLDASGNTSFPGTVTASAFSGNASSATKATQDGSGNNIVSTYATKAELSNHTSIQPFDYLDSNGGGTFWTQTNTNSIAVPFMTDSKVVTNKVRIFLESAEGAKIRCAIYKKLSASESCVLSLVAQTQLYIGQLDKLVGIPFETVATLDSDTLYYFVFECSSSDFTFVGKQISASLMIDFVYKGDAFNADSDTFKSQYPTDGPVTGNVFIPYFKII